MKILTAFYFSGTGNTRYMTRYLLSRLSSRYLCEMCDISKPCDAAAKIEASDLILFAFPVYGSAPPIPMRNFIHRCGKSLGGKQTAILCTQYFFSGDGAATIGRTAAKYGAKLVGAEIFNMPNNLADCKMFPVKNGAQIEKTLKRARRRADKFAERLLAGKGRLRGFSPLAHGVGYFSQRKYWQRGEAEKRSRLKIDAARCVKCGLCAKACPVKNILMENGPKPQGACVFCYRCVNLCPKKAVTLIGSEPPAVQYRGPEGRGHTP